jgi:hypothetical protein
MSAIKRPITPGPDSDAVEVQADKKMRDEDEDKTEENEEEEGEDEGDDEDEDGDKDAGKSEDKENEDEDEEEDPGQLTFDIVAEVTLKLKDKKPEEALEQAMTNLEAFRENQDVKTALTAALPEIHFLPELKTKYIQTQDDYQDPVALSVQFATVYYRPKAWMNSLVGLRIATQEVFYCPLTNLLFFDGEEDGIRVQPINKAAAFASMLKQWHPETTKFFSFEEYTQATKKESEKLQRVKKNKQPNGIMDA